MLDVLGKVHLFPVRHHSPRSARTLHAFLDAHQPELILVEGPSDATHLIEALTQPDTMPPVAILGYRSDGKTASSLWPFASYSPEYEALAWARKNKKEARFIDITVAQTLALHEPADMALLDADDDDGLGESDDDDDGAAGDNPGDAHDEYASDDVHAEREAFVSLEQQMANARGFRSFEEFWEASFEAPDYDEESFRTALVAYADIVRAQGDRARSRARDAYMTKRIAEAVQAGTDPQKICVVAGAAHVAAFACGDVDLSLDAALSAQVPSAITLIPYSFPRLAEQSGYGAGNRAPQYYQRAHDRNCDFRRATLEVLLEFTSHLRVRGFNASLADAIEAYRLACTLSDMRGKHAPGLDEVREAAVATMCRGDAQHVDGFLWRSVIGRNVGKVAAAIGKNSLQEEFWTELRARNLPQTDELEQFTLKLNDQVHIDTSIFLHRLRVGNIPYAGVTATDRRAAKNAAPEEAGGYAALSRIKEAWQAQWTPSVEVALVERIILGDNLREVCERTLAEQLAAATTTGAAATVLMESVVTQAPRVLGEALLACDRLASTDDDLPSLAAACRALSGLAHYGSSRATLAEAAIDVLCKKTYDRAVLRVMTACDGNDEAVESVKGALRTLHDVALTQPLVDKQAWLDVAAEVAQSYSLNAGCAGLSAGLLFLSQAWTEEQVQHAVTQRLSSMIEPDRAASFLAGFFEVNALVVAKNKELVKALDAFLCGIDKAVFKDTLPTLRKAFASLGATERRYLLENLLAVKNLGAKAMEARAVLKESDKEKLKEMSEDIEKAMGDLDDLL